MYRIKLGTGDESVFNSIEELSFGIGTGIIGEDAEIYHDRAEKWLPVTVHPAYKKAAANAPPPDKTHASSPEADPDPSADFQAEPSKNGSHETGQDLMTLLNLEELAEFDPRNVQESAATQDSAGPAETADEQAQEARTSVEHPVSAELSDTVDLPASDEKDGPYEDLEDVPISEIEFLEIPGDDEDIDEAPAEALAAAEPDAEATDEAIVDGFEPTTIDDEVDDSDLDLERSRPADLEEMLDASADLDDVSTQALDTVLDETSLEVEPDAEADLDEEAVDDQNDSEDVESGQDDRVGAEAVEEEHAEVDEPFEADDELGQPDAVAAEVGDLAESPPSEEGQMEVTRSFGDAWDDPDGTMDAADPDAADLDHNRDEEPTVPVGMIPDVEEDPIAAFDPEAEDGAAELAPVLSARLPTVNRKPLVVVAIVACLIIVAGVVWMLKGAAFAQGGDDPTPTATSAAAASVGSAVAGPDAQESDSAAQAMQLEYEEAYARAQVRFDDALRRAGFRNLFVATRFSSGSEMAAARAAIRNARRALGDYSVREGAIEDSYADADPSLRESRANRELAEDLLAVADSVYGLLLGNLESFAVRAGALTFTDNAVEARYARLRDEVDRLATLASEVEDGVQSASIHRIAAGIGTARPLPLSALAPAPALPPNLAPGN